MKVYIRRKNGSINAEGEYDSATGKLMVLAGSLVSLVVHQSKKFRMAKVFIQMRKECVVDGKMIKDIEFSSPSTAANFVTGSSSNGLIAWKTKEGITIKTLLANE